MSRQDDILAAIYEVVSASETDISYQIDGAASEIRERKLWSGTSNRGIHKFEKKKVKQTRTNGGASLRVNSALDELHSVYLQHKPELCAYLVKKLRVSSSEAEDVVQGAFEKIVAMPSAQFQAIKNVRAFLYKSVHNAGVDQQRHLDVGQRFVKEQCADQSSHADRRDPYRRVLGDQELQVLLAALKRMPEKRRRMIVMNRFDGLSCAEIARRLNLSETVVRKHVSRALAECQYALRLSSGEINR